MRIVDRKMALSDKTSSEAGNERNSSANGSQLMNTQPLKDVVQLLANEIELPNFDTEPISTKESMKATTNGGIKKNQECDNSGSSSTINEDSKSVVGSPPDCEPSHLENYKTPHSQRRSSAQLQKLHEDSPSNLCSFLQDKGDERKVPNAIKKWPGSVEVWLNMVYNEEATLRCHNARNNSGSGTNFLPRMRAILIDWIMEVCDVYQLRRNTYYLAVDYIDRFLDHKRCIPKTQLQLVGVTCLFIGAKIEEIYPPKLSEFAYVCDGACTENEILTCERLVLYSLGWDLNPMTPTNWLNLYMQIASMPSSVPHQLQQQFNNGNPTSTEIYFPVYSAYQFVRASQVMDLFSLDPAYGRFTYSVIGAAAMYLECGETAALSASGFSLDHIDMCLAHMSFFHKVLCNEDNPRLLSVLGSLTSNSFSFGTNNSSKGDESQAASYRAMRTVVPNLVRDEKHSMQTHCIDLDYYERAVVLRLEWLGFKVQKVYTKQYNNVTPGVETTTNSEDNDENRVHVENSEGNDTDKEAEEEEEPQDFSTVVTFQLERLWKISDENLIVNVKPEDTSSDTVDSEEKSLSQNNNIFTLTTSEKILVNFDGILSSVHLDCADKMFSTLWRQTQSD